MRVLLECGMHLGVCSGTREYGIRYCRYHYKGRKNIGGGIFHFHPVIIDKRNTLGKSVSHEYYISTLLLLTSKLH